MPDAQPPTLDPDCPPEPLVRRFLRRTHTHIALVRKNLEIVAAHPDHGHLAEELRRRGEEHDRSKFTEAELVPRIWLLEYYRCKAAGEPFEHPPGMSERVETALRLHMAANRHHPEYHADVNDMTEADVIEMVCDWTAVAELIHGARSALDWARQCVEVTYPFDAAHRELIFKIVHLLGER